MPVGNDAGSIIYENAIAAARHFFLPTRCILAIFPQVVKGIGFTYLSCLFLLGASSVLAAGRDPATKDDLKAVLQAIEKRFEQVDRRFEQIDRRFEQIDRRFEQIDKRFEHIDKRLEFHQSLLLVLIAGMIGSPFLIHYLARRREAADRQALDEARRAVIALRELSTKDKKVAEALRIAGLL